jgi:hydroxypyruvate reductase
VTSGSPPALDPLRADAEAIFRAALERVDPVPMMRRVLRLDGDLLRVETEETSAAYDLARFDRVVVTGAGKASARMALAVEALLGDRLAGGLVVVKAGHVERLRHVRLVEAAHPVPDATSVRAAEELLAFAATLDERTLVLTLISGGGSALLCAPAVGADGRPLLSLEEKQAVTRALLGCGATIHELNCVRKHLSRIKGGRLARAYGAATSLDLILSDVVGDDLDVIASGPTVADPTTYADALAVIARHRLADRIPAAALRVLEDGAAGRLPETPKPGAPELARARDVLVGTNHQALLAAEARARALGYRTLVLTSRLTGEAREAALLLLGVGEDVARRGVPLSPPACVIAGGETTVTLRGRGKGGRNQELALAVMARMLQARASPRLLLLAASTDGNDGPTDAAGAFASVGLAEAARARGLEPEPFLAENDSYAFHDRAGTLLRTGPTNTNVSDVAILLVR